MSLDENGDLAKRVLEIKLDVMHYLIEQPDAKDTAEGILQWWLPDAMHELGMNDLLVALNELFETGWITTSNFGGTTVYGLEWARRDEIRRWLGN